MTSGYLIFAPIAYYMIRNFTLNDHKVQIITKLTEEKENEKAKERRNNNNNNNNHNNDNNNTDSNNYHKITDKNVSTSLSLNYSRSFTETSILDKDDIIMLNFSPTENRALASIQTDKTVYSNLLQYNQMNLMLSLLCCLMLFTLFIYVSVIGHDTWTFMIIFFFLNCSIGGLYCYYRVGALNELKEWDMVKIAMYAQAAEISRLRDKQALDEINLTDMSMSMLIASPMGNHDRNNDRNTTTDDVIHSHNSDQLVVKSDDQGNLGDTLNFPNTTDNITNNPMRWKDQMNGLMPLSPEAALLSAASSESSPMVVHSLNDNTASTSQNNSHLVNSISNLNDSLASMASKPAILGHFSYVDENYILDNVSITAAFVIIVGGSIASFCLM